MTVLGGPRSSDHAAGGKRPQLSAAVEVDRQAARRRGARARRGAKRGGRLAVRARGRATRGREATQAAGDGLGDACGGGGGGYCFGAGFEEVSPGSAVEVARDEAWDVPRVADRVHARSRNRPTLSQRNAGAVSREEVGGTAGGVAGVVVGWRGTCRSDESSLHHVLLAL